MIFREIFMFRLFNQAVNTTRQLVHHYTAETPTLPNTREIATQTDLIAEVTQTNSSSDPRDEIINTLAKEIEYYTDGHEAYLEINIFQIKERQYDNLIPHCDELGQWTAHLWSPDNQTFYCMQKKNVNEEMISFTTSEENDTTPCQLKKTKNAVIIMHSQFKYYNLATLDETKALINQLIKNEVVIKPLQFKATPAYLYQFDDKNHYFYIEAHPNLSTEHQYKIKIKEGGVFKDYPGMIKGSVYTDVPVSLNKEGGYTSFHIQKKEEDIVMILNSTDGKLITLTKLDINNVDLQSIGIEQDKTNYPRVTPITPPPKELNKNETVTEASSSLKKAFQ